MKTKQETFDTVVRALLTQGKPSYDPNHGCRYRGPEGTKCAAGHLIPDDKYSPNMEGVTCHTTTTPENTYHRDAHDRCVAVMTVLKEEGYDPAFVRDLQKMHDYSIAPDAMLFRRRLVEGARIMASRDDLNLDVFDEFDIPKAAG